MIFSNGGVDFSFYGWFSNLWYVGGFVGDGVGDDGSVASGSCSHGEVVRIWFLKLLGVVAAATATKVRCD